MGLFEWEPTHVELTCGCGERIRLDPPVNIELTAVYCGACGEQIGLANIQTAVLSRSVTVEHKPDDYTIERPTTTQESVK